MAESFVRVEVEERVAVVMIDRQDKLNALNGAVMCELAETFDYIEGADFDFDGALPDTALEGLEEIQPEDFENEDLGLDEAMLDDSDASLEAEVDTLDDADLSTVDTDSLAEEMAPIAEEVAPLTQDFAPVIEEAAPIIEAEPMDLGSGGFDDGFDGGFDSFDGGGFDDIGGGFDDW